MCIEFSRRRLLDAVPTDGFQHGPVEYKKIKELRAKKVPDSQLAFVKRWAFKDEREYRIVFRAKDKLRGRISFRIEPNVVRRVVINPWMPDALFEATCQVLNKMEGGESLLVVKSHLTDSETWRVYAEGYR